MKSCKCYYGTGVCPYVTDCHPGYTYSRWVPIDATPVVSVDKSNGKDHTVKIYGYTKDHKLYITDEILLKGDTMFKKRNIKKAREEFIKKMESERFQRIHLIQRLRKPLKKPDTIISKLSEVFSFGGGIQNGGLTTDEMNLIRPLFRFEYMGSAEFEFGAVPKALATIVECFQHNWYSTGTIEVKAGKHLNNDKITIWYIAPPHIKDLVIEAIIDMAGNKRRVVEHTKEVVGLDVVCGYGYSTPAENDTCGWIELDNKFMFFTDQDMMDNTMNLFNKVNQHEQ